MIMNVIQSFWSKPLLTKYKDKARFWEEIPERFNMMLLSLLRLKKVFGKVTLYTDEYGKFLLVDTLKFPYDKVHIKLDALNSYPAHFWSIGKLYTYQLQEKAFLHFDNDVFVWEDVSRYLLSSSVLVQSKQYFRNYEFESDIRSLINKRLNNVPEPMVDIWSEKYQKEDNHWFNLGVIGVADENIDFIHEYTSKAFGFIDSNRDVVASNSQLHNMVYEEHLLAVLSKQNGICVKLLIPSISTDFKEVLQFPKAPFKSSYVHLAGEAKENPYSKQLIHLHLRGEFPIEYDQLSRFLKNDNDNFSSEGKVELIKLENSCYVESESDACIIDKDSFKCKAQLKINTVVSVFRTQFNEFRHSRNSDVDKWREVQVLHNKSIMDLSLVLNPCVQIECFELYSLKTNIESEVLELKDCTIMFKLEKYNLIKESELVGLDSLLINYNTSLIGENLCFSVYEKYPLGSIELSTIANQLENFLYKHFVCTGLLVLEVEPVT
jgi:hypothetical protein